jgi:hypothetical protein
MTWCHVVDWDVSSRCHVRAAILDSRMDSCRFPQTLQTASEEETTEGLVEFQNSSGSCLGRAAPPCCCGPANAETIVVGELRPRL